MRLPHRLQGQKVKSQGGAGPYCGGHLAAQLVIIIIIIVECPLAQLRALNLCYVNLHCFIFIFLFFFFFCLRYLNRSLPNLPGRWQIRCNRKVKLLVSEHFSKAEGRFKKVTFASGTASQNTTWRQNGFTYWKIKLTTQHYGKTVIVTVMKLLEMTANCSGIKLLNLVGK